MASTRNAFELLEGGVPSAVSKNKKKKGKGLKVPDNAGVTQNSLENVVAATVRELEAGASLDDFRPAASSRKGKTKDARGADLVTVALAASGETRAIAAAADSAGLLKLWEVWATKLAAESSGTDASLYRTDSGKTVDFKQVLLTSQALEKSLEAALALGLTPAAGQKLSEVLAVTLPHAAQCLASLLPASITELQTLVQTTQTPDVIQAAQAAFAKVLTAAKAGPGPEEGQGDVASQLSSLQEELAFVEHAVASAVSSKERNQLMESAERLARKGLDLATGNPTLSETNGLAEGQRALDELVSLVNRRLNQARVGASGFRDAVVQHAAQLKAEARLVDNEIEEVEGRLAALRRRATELALATQAQEEKATKGPTSGELNVKAFEQQLEAVRQLHGAPAVRAVLAPAQGVSSSDAAVAMAVAAHLRAVEGLLLTYREAQLEVLSKAQTASEMVAQAKRRGDQLSILSLADEQKRNAKSIETHTAALQELVAQAGVYVKRASEVMGNLQRSAGLAAAAHIMDARTRISGLFSELKAAEEQVMACNKPKLVKGTGRIADDPIVPTPPAANHINPVGSPAPKASLLPLAPVQEPPVDATRREPLLMTSESSAPPPAGLPNGVANGHPEAHVTADVALAADEKPQANGHVGKSSELANGDVDDGGFITAPSKKNRRNRRGPSQAATAAT